jgi:arylsulfatase A-like enzyme
MTLAELLRAQGFATWGFVDGGYLHSDFGFDQGFDHYDDIGGGIAVIIEKVEAWLETHAVDRFFLFIHCYDVHSPYAPPPPYDTLFEERPYAGDFEATTANLKQVADLRRRISTEDLRHVVALYDGGIRYTDEQLGRFLERLEGDGLLESTIVIVTSDHGEEFLEHGSMLHGQIYFMPDLHVPLIFFIPGLPSQTIAGPVELIDVLPTVLDLLELPPYPEAMGRSLAPVIRGQKRADRDRIAFAERGPDVDLWPWSTVVSDDHQLFLNVKSGERRLFDTRSDPAAGKDIADSETMVTERLVADLEERRRRAEAVSQQELWPATEAATVEETTMKKLQALGYLDD